MSLLLTGALFVGLMAAPALADDSEAPSIGEIVIEVSSTDGPDKNGKDFDILLAAVLADDLLTAAVLGTGDFEGVDLTVFAPNDRAFMKLTGTDSEKAAVDALMGLVGTPALQNIVLYHVVAGEALSSSDVFSNRWWKTMFFDMANGDVLKSRNGKLIDGIDNRVRVVDGAVDIKASNGVIHTIKEVLTPPPAPEKSIGEIVIDVSSMEGPDMNSKDYDILLAAVLADELLTAAVLGTGAFEGVDLTVFAPNDKAFMRLTGTDSEKAAVEALSGLIGTPALQDIVLYHVIAGQELSAERVFLDGFWKTKKFEMANGDTLKVRWFRLIDGTRNWVAPNANALDIRATNGVIHTIREVLMPPADVK
jgi:uncharacterized surface protein with fasciclin (FAS1) repeats